MRAFARSERGGGDEGGATRGLRSGRMGALAGTAFGACFPVVSLLALWLTGESPPPHAAADGLAGAIGVAHVGHPLLWVIDLAPPILGLAGALVGRRQGEVRRLLGHVRAERDAAAVAQAAAAASEQRFRAIFDHAALGVVLLDATGRILEANPAVQQLLGYTREELGAMAAADLSPPEEAELTREPVRILHAGEVDRVQVEKRMRRRDGEIRLCEFTITRAAALGAGDGLVAMMRDITEHRALQDTLAYRAHHDVLTGLANRAHFHDALDGALSEAASAGGADGASRVAVLLVDLDGFKLVNDTAGHAAGDGLLRHVAGRLRNATRGCDLVARLGGDEFAVLLTNVRGDDDARIVADRIVSAIARPFALADGMAIVGASVGIARGGALGHAAGARADTGEGARAVAPEVRADRCEPLAAADELLRDADLALYEAKARGRGQAVCFAPDMHSAVVERRALEQALRDGLARGEFRLWYQPIVDLATGRVRAAEALVRWEHPRRGLVAPGAFVPLAEETGLIVPLGGWVLRTACEDAAGWAGDAEGGAAPYVTVNVSGRQLARPEFVDEVADALAASGLPPERLTLELTESTVIAHPEATRLRLRALKALGVRLAIDDFGTGYSALAYLRQFPIDLLKIDKSFVDEVAAGGEAAALAGAIVGVGQALRLGTVAEGVETAAQAEALRQMGCALAQGFHFSRPLPAAAAHEWIARAGRGVDRERDRGAVASLRTAQVAVGVG